jgi:hypothetical protein
MEFGTVIFALEDNTHNGSGQLLLQPIHSTIVLQFQQ